MKLMATSAVGVGAASALSACKLHGGGGSIQTMIRFVNLANNTPFTVQFQTAGTTNVVPTSFGTIAFETVTKYMPVPWEGQYTLQLLSPTTGGTSGNVMASFSPLSLNQGTSYTIIVYASGSTLAYSIINDTLYNGPASNQFIVSAMSTMTEAATVSGFSLFLTAVSASDTDAVGQGKALTPLTPTSLVNGAGANSPSWSQYINTGNYRIRFAQGNSGNGNAKTVLFDNAGFNFNTASGNYYFVLYTRGSGLLPTVLLLQPQSDTATQILANPLVRVRAIQGSPDLVTTNVAVGSNGNKLPFGSSTSYYILPASNVSVTFQDVSTGTKATAPYLSYSNTSLAGGYDYAVYSVGVSSSATAWETQDQNLSVNTASEMGVFFVNALPSGDKTAAGTSTASVNAYIGTSEVSVAGTTVVAQSLVAPSAADQVDLAAPVAGSQISFTIAGQPQSQLGPALSTGNTTTTVTINGVQQTITLPALNAGGLYTMALVGANGTYLPTLFQNNQS